MKKQNKQTGITLVALVVTIVILLILAGVSLNLVLGENGIVRRANEARSRTRIASDQEAVQMAVFGIMLDGDLTSQKLEDELNKTRNGEFTISEADGIITVSFNGGKSFAVNKTTGEVALVGPSVQVANVKVVNASGTEVAENTQEAGTALYIKFTASIEEGEITSVKYNGTEALTADTNGVYTKEISQNGDYSFSIVGTVEGQEYTKTYTKTVNEYAKVEFTAADITTSASTYYGSYVTNYNPSGSGYIKDATATTAWRIFYADANNIYLIASNYINYQGMPTVNSKSAATYTGDNLATYPYRGNFNNIYSEYTGSNAIASGMRYLNKNYFEYLATQNPASSSNPNMQSVAYMLDTAKWNTNYKTADAEWAIGGPSLELLFASYNGKYPTSQLVAGSVSANTETTETIKLNGYKFSKNGGSSWTTGATTVLNQGDSLYRIGSNSNDDAKAYWLASPSAGKDNYLLVVYFYGTVDCDGYSSTAHGFRPLVRLNSGVKLEPDPASAGNYRIAD